MKIRSRLNINFDLEVQIKSRTKRKKSRKKTFLRKSMIWIALELLSILMEKLVAWIIKTLMNRPFYYFYNRFFYLKERWYFNE